MRGRGQTSYRINIDDDLASVLSEIAAQRGIATRDLLEAIVRDVLVDDIMAHEGPEPGTPVH